MGEFKNKHNLGQNFLQDKNVLAKMIDCVDVKENDLVIEIGPGQGALTKFLKLYKSNLRGYEIDKRVEKYLKIYEDDKTKIIFKDFMQVDIYDEVKNIEYDKLYVIANLPYYITSPIIEKIINSDLDVEAMVLMVQNEVADRFSAKPGSRDYGAISVYLQYYFDVEKLFFVNRKCFYPVPNVDSAVIRLKKKNRINEVINMDKFKEIVKNSFVMKRKNIKNNLKTYDLKVIEKILNKYDLDLNCRAEDIPVDCFVELVNELEKVND